MADSLTSESPGAVQLGTHACLLYRGVGEYTDAVIGALDRARELDQAVLWIGRESDSSLFRDLAERAGWSVGGDGDRAEGSVRLVGASTVVTDDGTLDRTALMQLMRDETRGALDAGHSGIQVIQEMGGWIAPPGGTMAVKRYEADLATFLPGSSCRVLCLYDRESCTPDQLLALLELHSRVSLDGESVENIYAISPQDLLDLDLPRATLDRRLQKLADHRAAEETRRMYTAMVEFLHDVVWAGYVASTVDEVIQIVLEKMSEQIGWPLAHAYRFDEEARELAPTGLWYGRDDERFQMLRALTEATGFPLGVGLPGLAAEDGRPIWVSDIRTDPTFLRSRWKKDLGVRSALAVPIASNGRLHAVFEFFSVSRMDVDPILVAVLEEVAAQLTEVIERKEAENELRLLEAAVSHLGEAILILTPDVSHPEGPRIVYTNHAIEATVGYAREDVTGRRTEVLFDSKTNDLVRGRVEDCSSEGQTVSGELIASRKDDSDFVLEYRMSPVRTQEGRITHVAAVFRDVTAERRAEEAIRRADHDSLTGLPNRDLFTRRLGRSVERVQESPDERFALLFMDLDRFKVVNDSLGHLRGDQLLVSLARRLERAVRPGDTLARFGGDEFVILLDRVDTMEDVTTVARRIEEELASPFTIENQDVYTTASIGIALSDTEYTLPKDVLRDADRAMYRAKSKGGATYEIFDGSLAADDALEPGEADPASRWFDL